MKILVTGGAGYIGSVATYLLLSKGHEVVIVDNLTTGYKGPITFFEQNFGKEKLRFYKSDLRDPIDQIFEKEKGVDAVLHYAASCMVNESMENPHKYFLNNVCGSLNLLSTMQKFSVNQIVFSSTCAVYGEAEYTPIDEAHPRKPSNPYGESKKMVEDAIQWYGRLSGFKYAILRYFNVCGASDDGKIGDSKKPSSLLVQNAVRGALGIEPFYLTCPKVDTPDGTPIRDYINVADLNEAHIKALEYLTKGSDSGVFNLGTGTGNSVLEIVKKVEEITGFKFDLKKSEPRKGEYAKMIADIGNAKKILGWEPKRSLEDSVKSLIAWYGRHPHGWKE